MESNKTERGRRRNTIVGKWLWVLAGQMERGTAPLSQFDFCSATVVPCNSTRAGLASAVNRGPVTYFVLSLLLASLVTPFSKAHTEYQFLYTSYLQPI